VPASPALRFRAARPGAARAVAALHAASWQRHYRGAFSDAFLDQDATWGAFLDNLHVTSGLKRQGIGTRLLALTGQAVLDRSPSSGLYLWVLEQNRDARAFYTARGGTCVERGPVASQAETPPGSTARRQASGTHGATHPSCSQATRNDLRCRGRWRHPRCRDGLPNRQAAIVKLWRALHPQQAALNVLNQGARTLRTQAAEYRDPRFRPCFPGSVGRPAWLWPPSDSGPAAALDGRQRFCTSEGVHPVRPPQIKVGAIAHRAMWGYGVDPPSLRAPSS
jgi:GNAT superfamily N-acetyltransferase